MKKIIVLLFATLALGIYAFKLTSNISLGDTIDSVGLTEEETINSVDTKRFGDIKRYRGITTVVNGTASSTDTEDESITIIDDINDFALMNGSSGHFKLTKNISVPNNVTTLGIETFDGVFNGGGYTISNLKGPFVTTLTGTICNLIIDSPREFTAVLDEATLVRHTISNTLYGFTLDNSYSQVAPQYFGFVSGTVTGGVIDNVKVNNAKINTNGSTEGEFDTKINTTGYMGFIAGHTNQVTYIKNCTVSNSTLVHSSAYAVGGIVGYSNHSYIKGCLVYNLNVTGKNDLSIKTMPKAFTGLLVGVSMRGGLSENIIADISQTSTPYLSFLGAALYYTNTGTLSIKNIYYDETVADFSKPGMDEGYEQIIQITNDPINSSNATVDKYGHVYDIDESSVGYYRTLAISKINRYTSTSLSSIISDYNSILQVSGYALKRNTTTYNIDNYVADDEKVIAINCSISEDLSYGDYLMDKVSLEIDTSKTNFETEVRFQYKFEGSSYFSDLTEDSKVSKMAGEYRVVYIKEGTSYVIEEAGGTFNIKPFDMKNAVVRVSSHTYNGKEQKVTLNVSTPSGLGFKVSLSGTTTATDVGVYDVVVIAGDSNTTGSVTKQWEIKIGNMTLSSSDIQQAYDGNYHSIKVTAPDNTTLTYSTDGIEYTLENPSFKDAGTYTVYYKGSNPNYNDASGSATVTINQLGLKVTWGETSLLYNGQEQIPSVTLGNIKGDDVVNITGMSGAAIKVGNNYTATILGIDNPNYKLPTEPSTKFKITPILVEVPSISSKEYTGEVLYADVDESEGYTIEGFNYGTNVGIYKFSLTPKANHTWVTGDKHTLSYEFEITKATNDWIIAPSIENWTYGEEPSELVFQSKFGTPGVRYFVAETEEMLLYVPTEAGDYKVTISSGTAHNYDGALNETLYFTIYKANPTYVVPTNLTAIYGNTLSDITLPSDENGAWSFVEDGNMLLDEAKEYSFTLVYTPMDSNNYNTIEEVVTVNVLKAEAVYTTPTIITELTYDGEEQALINAGSTNDGTIEYKLDNGDYSTSIPTAKDAKTYIVYYRIVGDENHNNVDEQSLQVSISPLKVNIVSATLNEVHISENGYELRVSNVIFDTELAVNDYEVSSVTLTGNNEVGAQNVDVVINVTNTNYELISNTIISTVNITGHEANLDDDCTTKVTCKYCDYVFIEARLAHEGQEDDDDCTTEVKCKHCDYVVIEGHLVHEGQEDDDDCTTAIICNNCATIVVDAKTHKLSTTYTKEDDGHYTHCENENCEYVSSKESHISSGEATEEKAEVCTICDYIITPALNHTHSKLNSSLSDETHHYYACDGCEEKLEIAPHSFTINTKVDETHHKEVCVCGKERLGTHSYGDWVVINPRNTEKGRKIKTCACGHEIVEEIPITTPIITSIEPEDGLSTGAIVGIVIGSIIAIGAAVGAIFWFGVKKRR